MELTKDVILRGTAWAKAADNLSGIFKTRPHYMLFMLSISIGIMYDKRIEKLEENGEDPPERQKRCWAGGSDVVGGPSLNESGAPIPGSPVGLRKDARGKAGTPCSRSYPALRTEWSRPRRSAPLPGCPRPCRWTSGPETGPAWRSWTAGRH